MLEDMLRVLAEVSPQAAWVLVFFAVIVGVFVVLSAIATCVTIFAPNPEQRKVCYRVFRDLLGLFRRGDDPLAPGEAEEAGGHPACRASLLSGSISCVAKVSATGGSPSCSTPRVSPAGGGTCWLRSSARDEAQLGALKGSKASGPRRVRSSRTSLRSRGVMPRCLGIVTSSAEPGNHPVDASTPRARGFQSCLRAGGQFSHRAPVQKAVGAEAPWLPGCGYV